MQVFTAVLNGLTLGGLLFLVSSGFTIMFGLMRVLNLAHGAFYMWGALIGASVLTATGSFLVALLAATLAIALLGLVTELTLFRRVRGKPIQEVLLTLGMGMVLGDVALTLFGGHPRRVPAPGFLSGSVDLFGITFPRYRLALLVMALLLYIALYLALERTKLGATIRAGVDDREMLEALGTNIKLLGTVVFVASAGLVGASGLLGAAFLGVYPGVDIDILVFAVVVVIIGGLGSLDGAALGSAAVGLLFSFGSVYTPAFLYFIMFGPVIVFLFFRPHGLRGLPA